MIAEKRWSQIVDIVNVRGAVSVLELMELLDASESTIRRDLVRLDSMGHLRKVHGGAGKLVSEFSEYIMADESLAGRKALHVEEKRAIGRFAASLIGPDDFVFIDGGSTTEFLVDAIEERRATFLTNSLPHAQKLLAKGCRTLLPGGEIKPVTEVMVGEETITHIRRFNFTLSFLGTNGVGLKAGFTTPDFGEAAVKELVIEHSLKPYVVCDSSKFSQSSLVSFARLDEATIITEKLSDENYYDKGAVIEVDKL